jgi:uncharacterized protein (DUF1501 family)
VKHTRRDLLRYSACGLLGRAAFLSGFDRFSMVSAMASPLADYKALVCIFMFGGNDSNNMLVPTDAVRYQNYSTKRGALAIPSATLLPINPKSGGSYGLHPNMSSLQPLFTTPGRGQSTPPLALACNVGTLTAPLTKAMYTSGVSRPYQLFSHSDQQNQWQTGTSTSDIPTGWGGRMADITDVTTGFPTVCSVAGVSAFSVGSITQPIALAPAPTPLNQTLKLLQADPNHLIQNVLTGDQSAATPTLIKGAGNITQDAVNNSALLSTDPSLVLTKPFPATGLGNQLLQVAKLITLAPAFGLKRQIFFCSIGGFDTHTVQLNAQKSLLQQLGDAMAAFYSATVDLGVSSAVTAFTLSDFSRTFVPAQTDPTTVGSDHAWGSHHLILGDAVKGGDIYGVFPDCLVGQTQDADSGASARGRWIPTSSVDEYAATLALWYGLANTDLPTVFPNIANFSHPGGLGFMM